MGEAFFLAAAILLLGSVVASKAAGRFGIPALLVFLGLGMLAGSDGLGGIHFDNAPLAKRVGELALAFILFSGGLDTSWRTIKPVMARGILLSTVGVVITTVLVGLFATFFLDSSLGLSPWEGGLLGAIIASTDAAAVFSSLRAKNIHVGNSIKPLLELESGSNDPMAILLTLGILQVIKNPALPLWKILPFFGKQVFLGALLGYGGGRFAVWLINRLNLEVEGLYPVLTIGVTLLFYGSAELLGGNGFLAVYVGGIILGNSNFLRKKTLVLFHDGMAWLMQIAMFLILGLLVFPKELKSVALSGCLLAVFLVLVARPVSVFLSLAFSRWNWKEKIVISWMGLRGAVPIVLALYATVPSGKMIFNLVFFVVLVSVLLQGTTMPWVTRWLRLDPPVEPKVRYPSPFITENAIRDELQEVLVIATSFLEGKTLLDLGRSIEILVVLIHRQGRVIVPRGNTRLLAGDILFLLGEKGAIDVVRGWAIPSVSQKNPEPEDYK